MQWVVGGEEGGVRGRISMVRGEEGEEEEEEDYLDCNSGVKLLQPSTAVAEC